VFDDDRVRGTHQHMMLQVDLVRLRAEAGLTWDKDFIQSFFLFWNNCNILYY